MSYKDIEALKRQKREADELWKKQHTRETGLDSNGYHDIDGEFISLRDSSGGLSTGVSGVDGSGDVTLYNKKTDKHHTIVKGTGNQSNSQSFIDSHNKQLRSSLVVKENAPNSVAEVEQALVNRQRRREEAEDGSYGNTSNGVVL